MVPVRELPVHGTRCPEEQPRVLVSSKGVSVSLGRDAAAPSIVPQSPLAFAARPPDGLLFRKVQGGVFKAERVLAGELRVAVRQECLRGELRNRDPQPPVSLPRTEGASRWGTFG